MNFYLIFDHYYSGIIQSQVIDVIECVEQNSSEKFRVIAFVNLRVFFAAKKKYQANTDRVTVLPNFGFSRWFYSLVFLVPLVILERPKRIIGRSVFACLLALKVKSIGFKGQVILDARGAESAEWEEFFFPENDGPILNSELKRLERFVVSKSDAQLAVSSKLIEYWKNSLGLSDENISATVIPSTIALSFQSRELSEFEIESIRASLGFTTTSCIYVFSGSASDWHSLKKVLKFCSDISEFQNNARFLFLTNSDLELTEFPSLVGKIEVRWLKQEDVQDYLLACDRALLLRGYSVTSLVSSPVKFAEYLASGLEILISENIGDLSELVEKSKLGYIIKDWKVSPDTFLKETIPRASLIKFAEDHFTKKTLIKDYLTSFKIS